MNDLLQTSVLIEIETRKLRILVGDFAS